MNHSLTIKYFRISISYIGVEPLLIGCSILCCSPLPIISSYLQPGLMYSIVMKSSWLPLYNLARRIAANSLYACKHTFIYLVSFLIYSFIMCDINSSIGYNLSVVVDSCITKALVDCECYIILFVG